MIDFLNRKTDPQRDRADLSAVDFFDESSADRLALRRLCDSAPLRNYDQCEQQESRQCEPLLRRLPIAHFDAQQAILVTDIESRAFGFAVHAYIDDIPLAVVRRGIEFDAGAFETALGAAV